VVVRAQDGAVDDPKIGLPQLFIQRQGAIRRAAHIRHRAGGVKIGDVERLRAGGCLRVGGRSRNMLKLTEIRHAESKLPWDGGPRSLADSCKSYRDGTWTPRPTSSWHGTAGWRRNDMAQKLKQIPIFTSRARRLPLLLSLAAIAAAGCALAPTRVPTPR